MDIDDKKLLAEKVMGWVFKKYFTKGLIMEVEEFIKPDGTRIPSDDFNPDHHTPEGLMQFCELLQKLSPDQRLGVIKKLKHIPQYLKLYSGIDDLETTNWILTHQPEVCAAIVEAARREME